MSQQSIVYLDHHAATPVIPQALQSMVAAAEASWANPSSVHRFGRASRQLLEAAREKVACALGAEPSEVIFTSGGTESCNQGIAGLVCEYNLRRVITTDVEHPAVARTIEKLPGTVAVEKLAVPRGEVPSARDLEQALSSSKTPTLVALQWINHEVGIVFPIQEYAEVCSRHGAYFFVDGTQAAGKLPVDFRGVGLDALATASHKLGGPSGSGALLLSRKRAVQSLLHGGGQERGLRAGSQDVAQHVGFGVACEQLAARCHAVADLRTLQQSLETELEALGFEITAKHCERISTVVHGASHQRRGDRLVAALDLRGICISSGAACSSGVSESSPIVRAMYASEPWRADGGIRFSFGPETTKDETDRAIFALRGILAG